MLKNKNTIITGGSDGIGIAIAEAFAKNGANVCLIARNEDKLQNAKEQLSVYGTEIRTIAADLSNISKIQSVSAKIIESADGVDVLVNNAGVGRFIPFTETTEELLDMHINLNIKAPYLLTQAFYESLAERKGNVINISSYFSHRMLTGRASTAYSLTKGAIDSFTKALAFEAGRLGIRVNAIAPGSIDTPQLQFNLTKYSAEEQTKFAEMVKSIYPLGKIGNPEDIANGAVYLASDMAKWVTGTILAIDGGLTTN